MWSHTLHRVLNLLPQIRKLILFLNALRCLLKHPRIIYRLLKFTFALERVQEIQSGLTLPHLLIILGILQLCHTFALCFYSAELWPRQPTEITSLPGIARSPPLLSQAVSCPHPDLAAQWQSQRHTLQMLTLSCSFSSFFSSRYMMPGFWLPEQELSTRVVTLPRLKVTLCSDRMDLKVQAERSTDVTWNHLRSRERQNQVWGRRERLMAQGDDRISSCPVALLDYSRLCKVTLYLNLKSHFNTFWHFLERIVAI